MKYKKAKYLEEYERQRGKMTLEEIKPFLSVQASFESHIKHSNSFNLGNKVGKIEDKNPFDYAPYNNKEKKDEKNSDNSINNKHRTLCRF